MAAGRTPAAGPTTAEDPVLVVGAGPGGLAVAAALGRRGVPAVVLERSGVVGASWRATYDRLRLHTTRRLSRLPGTPIPRRAGRWVARDDLIRYLEDYVREHRLEVRTGVEVAAVRRDGDRWLLTCADGSTLTSSDVVVATGYNHTPSVPAWPGRERWGGTLLHARQYREPSPYRGKDVIVVGLGNTGADIALDLVEGGARRVRVSFRTAPHVVRRSNAGWPAQATGILVRRLPDAVVDRLARVVARLEVPDLSAHGLPRPTTGLASRVRVGSVPLQDVGLVAAVQAGLVEPVPAVVALEPDAVVLADGQRVTPEVVVVAAGYTHGLDGLVGDLGLLDGRGLPVVHGARTAPHAPGLWFTGYTNPISGMLRELRIDALRIARAVARRRRRRVRAGQPLTAPSTRSV